MTNRHAPSELVSLFKLTPVIQELESVDRIYRFLLALVVNARAIGCRRAMLFVVDEADRVIRGRYGAERLDRAADGETGERGFEELARDVFDTLERVEACDLTVQARAFTVPLAWQGSAMVKSVPGAYPVLAERGLSEFSTDPFFEFFAADRYISVPVQFNGRTTALLTAEPGPRRAGSVDDVSLLHSLSQLAAAAAGHRLGMSDARRKARILWKLHEVLGHDPERGTRDEAVKLGLVMLSRAVGATGIFLKDLTRQKTVHIKSVREYAPDVAEDDVAVGEDFEEILDLSAGTVEPVFGSGDHPALGHAAARAVQFFCAYPLVAGGDVVGSLAVYTAPGGRTVPERTDYTDEDKGFIQLCAGIIASRIDGAEKDHRIRRIEDCMQEMGSNLARERDRAREADAAREYQDRMRESLGELSKELSSRRPYAARFPRIAAIVESMEKLSAAHRSNRAGRDGRYAMIDLFDLARRVVGDVQKSTAARGIELAVRIPDRGPFLLMDPRRIELALKNILATTVTGLDRRGRMLVECSQADERAIICVADNGAGLPGDALSRLFMPFESTSGGDDDKRALSLAGEIIHRHGGEVMVRSSSGWKTILVLRFPIAANRDRRKKRRDRRHRPERRTRVKIR